MCAQLEIINMCAQLEIINMCAQLEFQNSSCNINKINRLKTKNFI